MGADRPDAPWVGGERLGDVAPSHTHTSLPHTPLIHIHTPPTPRAVELVETRDCLVPTVTPQGGEGTRFTN